MRVEPPPTVIFDSAEYEARLDATRDRMRARGIDSLIVTDPANMHYLTGYDGWSFYTPQGVVVPVEGEVVLFTGGWIPAALG